MQFTHSTGEDVDAQADTEPAPVPLFNMTPDPGHVATLSGTFLFVTITIEVDVHSPGSTSCDSSSCQLVGTLSSASTLLTLEGSSLTLWGVPGDPSHDSQRCGENLAESQLPAVGGVQGSLPDQPDELLDWRDSQRHGHLLSRRVRARSRFR